LFHVGVANYRLDLEIMGQFNITQEQRTRTGSILGTFGDGSKGKQHQTTGKTTDGEPPAGIWEKEHQGQPAAGDFLLRCSITSVHGFTSLTPRVRLPRPAGKPGSGGPPKLTAAPRCCPLVHDGASLHPWRRGGDLFRCWRCLTVTPASGAPSRRSV
jgi:hypothetical protein